ncbi:hypothetical protein EHI8A_116300 [Entamoeba histolytica HM-1:IMSS-B]|uniref:Aquaporin n=6 Tax=Entamoeba histolytica TaxID=5759 RepID=C4LYT9_ENTH1|nr:hypothetical protein EHI_010520 [Entamoeba histolytica HM-1:IMSS]EMD44283.1 Hypothetical protein EHI5A_064140 [Entamoeba histolytica KU27]EMH72371.1 hypothetical protein EHI8A_116300 [Entamoeba histolytica HM-1:IMSS-B]EMS15916.1 hypothetical protein KM1_184940 [Entamoeba histolytica HM-3:IMSS]ENY63121.1 hypothetical protein EHI7A_107770 [Entamoeba histolytica HM-1:IMSS-A]GAT94004.1 hypothetical protein CL6EHI_010520 [Entamoeba histolytica]|eukprot:XP_650068.1 hypothetical protein EHI_010520 [Entamoeba histolytica HM-1:IMSS]
MEKLASRLRTSTFYGYYMKYRLLCHNKLIRFFIGELIGSYYLFYLTNCTAYLNYPTYICSLLVIFGLGPIIEILSPVCNGQFNTGISIVFFLRRGQTFWQTLVSIVAQFLGGLFSVLTLNLFFTDSLIAFSSKTYSFIQVLSECFGSFILIFVLMLITYRKQSAALLIPGVIAAGCIALPSGMIVNPFIVVCRLISNSNNNISWQSCLVLLFSEFIGFALGFLTGEFILVEGEREVPENYYKLENVEIKSETSNQLESVFVDSQQPINEEIPMN